jgi:UDP-glucose 4-epimerase
MKILLLGGAGYIGTHVALEFLSRGDTVGVYDNLSSGLEENILPSCMFYHGDILDTRRLNKVCAEGWDAAVHLAAFKAAGESMTNPAKYSVNNITGSLNIIVECLANSIPYFILSSSAAVYGSPRYVPIDEEHPVEPENYYGYTKLVIERNLEWYHQLKGLQYASLRYFNAAGYDPDQRMSGLEKNPANLIPVIMETASGTRERLEIFGRDYPTRDGTGVRDYVHVTDLAAGHAAALDFIVSNNTSITVNLGSERGMSVLEVLEEARRITGREIPSADLPRRAGDPPELVASSAKAERLLGWKPRFSDLHTILDTTWSAYRKHSV